MDMTLREIQASLGVSRRAVQGYEKAGLVTATGRNHYGHLLYDAKACDRIRKIKRYQQYGFSIKEICHIIDAPREVLIIALKQQLEHMLALRTELENDIRQIKREIEYEEK